MSTSAEGIDVSAFQLDLTIHDLAGLQFAFTKATDGPTETDPNFTHNWAAIKQAGAHRGTYHELQAGAAGQQAQHFLATVQAQGLEAGDMLAVVASDYPGVTDAEVLTFCEVVRQATHGHNPVLCYTDLSVGGGLWLTSGAGFPLWVAWPSPVAPTLPLANWKRWTCWQWGTRLVPGLGHVDANGYNGTPAEMDAWIASFKPKPKPPPKPPAKASLLQGDDTMLLIPAGFTETIAVPVPGGVAQPAAAWGVPFVVRLSSASPASFEIAFGHADPAKWQPVTIDYARSPQGVKLPLDDTGAPVTVLKLRPQAGGNPAPVTVDFG